MIRCSSFAEMPFLRDEISNTARNHSLSGLCVLCSSVPAVRLVWWPHSAHSKVKSLCIHSQLKSPSSSEVASMIEGVLRHCTEMEVDRHDEPICSLILAIGYRVRDRGDGDCSPPTGRLRP